MANSAFFLMFSSTLCSNLRLLHAGPTTQAQQPGASDAWIEIESLFCVFVLDDEFVKMARTLLLERVSFSEIVACIHFRNSIETHHGSAIF